jgi:hypothetical protein
MELGLREGFRACGSALVLGCPDPVNQRALGVSQVNATGALAGRLHLYLASETHQAVLFHASAAVETL